MIYLASSSPRRRVLLRQAGLRYKILRPSYEEKNHGGSALFLTKRHALGKAMSVMPRVREGLILGADTVVVSGGRILGKPSSMKAAERMLGGLQGRTHAVVTAVALIRMRRGWPAKQIVFTEKSSVRLKKMAVPELRAYLRRIGPLDKAGAYAAQDSGGPSTSSGSGAVERVRGSFTNVVGLPMEKLKKMLRVLR